MFTSIAYNDVVIFSNMQNQKNKFVALLTWLLPSGSELIIASTFTIATLAISNSTVVRDLIFLPQDFQIKTAALDSLSRLIETVFGDQIARSGVVAIFWALVGLFVYILIWLGLNFSNELGNDLALTKYLHPRHVDTHSRLRDLISKVVFRAMALFILIFYVNLVMSTLLPYIGGMFRVTLQQWPSMISLKYLGLGVILEIVALHGLVVMIRAIILRKRVFG